MSFEALLVGPAPAVSDAVASLVDWAPPNLRLLGAALIGPGDVTVTVAARAPTWETLDVGAARPAAMVLTQTPSAAALRVVLARAAEAHAKVFVLSARRMRPLQLDDLLAALPGEAEWSHAQALIRGKRVLITGGGGSIGAELARQTSAMGASRLTLLDSSEYNLHKISLELPDAELALADVRDGASVRRWFKRAAPEVVFHTAALKQVPLVERFPSEGVLTNVAGLRNVCEAAQAGGADVIFVSTDKAVEPSGVMGASKRLGELYCQALDRRGEARALPIRLGNVMGSAGSVAPVFERQLRAGGPLTVTDSEVTRFFMSIPQAAGALLQAGAVGLAAERMRGVALTIDMGEPVSIVDLAHDMIRLEGLRPNEDVRIVYTGLRPGEKLHESLVASYEWREPDPAPGVIAAASEPRGLPELLQIMDRLAMLAREGADEAVSMELSAAIAPRDAADAALKERMAAS